MIIVSRLLCMGLPDYVHIAAYASWQVPWGKHSRLGRDHDAACHPQNIRSLLRSTTPPR